MWAVGNAQAAGEEISRCLRPEEILVVRSISDPQFDPGGTAADSVEEWFDARNDRSYPNLWLIRKLTDIGGTVLKGLPA